MLCALGACTPRGKLGFSLWVKCHVRLCLLGSCWVITEAQEQNSKVPTQPGAYKGESTGVLREAHSQLYLATSSRHLEHVI